VKYSEHVEQGEKIMKITGVASALCGTALEIAALFLRKKDKKASKDLSEVGLLLGGIGLGMGLGAKPIAELDAKSALNRGLIEADEVDG
jgi:hypothetical protein